MTLKISRRNFIWLSTLTSACSFTPLTNLSTNDPWQRADQIRHALHDPIIPKQVFNVLEYGAIGDGLTINTAAFANAINTCAKAGGGRITIPAGQYLTGAIHLQSNIELHVESGAVLLFSTNPKDYPTVFSRYEGVEVYNYSALIYARDCENIAITGKGLLHGQAADENWWSWCGSPKFGWQPGMPRQTEDRDLLFNMAEQGIAVEKRVFGLGHYLRPSLIEFYNCKNVLIEDVSLQDSPFWNIHPILCQNVIVRGVNVTGHGPNNDGCNPESVNTMLIENCRFDTGDDCIAIKSGRNADGRRLATPSKNILINQCQMKAGHGGVVIGSEISGDVHHVFIEHCQMDSPDLWYALRFKNNAMRGGRIANIYARDIEVGQVTFAAITCDFNYEEGANGQFTPELYNLNVQRLHVQNAVRVLDSQGLLGAPISGIHLKDCSFHGVSEKSIVKHTRELTLDNVQINGKTIHSLT
ncbi:glycoside hydrolase family 28 protein [Alteromonadaceae bacterium BrNp21-10]|nr:glycoside hydrolase family 28 protein [Alteromonadaceae bacterium BrNp21-10]